MKIRNYILNDLVVGVDDSYVTKPDDVQLSFIEAQIDTGSTGKIKKIGGKLLRNIPYKLDNNYLENEKEDFEFVILDADVSTATETFGQKSVHVLQTELNSLTNHSNDIVKNTVSDLFKISKIEGKTLYSIVMPSHSKYNISDSTKPLINSIYSLNIEVEDTNNSAPDISKIKCQAFTRDTLNVGAPVGAFKGDLLTINM